MLPWDFKEIIDSILILCQNYKKIDPTFLQWFLRRADGMFPYSAAVNNSKIIEYIDLISLKNNKYVNSMFSTESFTLSTTNKKKLKIKRVDWSIYPYHILYTPPRLLEFIRYFTDLYSNFVDKHLKIFTSPILLKYVNFSMITEKVFLSEIFSSLEWKKSTIIIRGKPCLSKVITREITDFDLYVKNFKYSPIDLNKFIFVNNTINSIYYDCYGNQFTFHNYFETAHWFITHSKYFLHSRDVINVNNFKIWSKFYPRGISTTEAFVSFIDFQDFNKYFKNIISSSFDFSNSQYIFKRENDKFQYLFSFSNTFDNSEKSNLKLGFFLSYKMDFHLFRFLSSFFFLSIFENSFLSDWVTSLYFHVAKDLIITSKSDFNILYKTTASWNNYRELNLSANGKWFLESKIVNQKIIYDWKWKNNFNTFVPIDQYKVQHFVPGKNFSEIKINTLRDSVSHKIDKKILNEIFILNKLIEEKIPKEESEAIRIMWEDYRRYRTCRFWRHFPHHAAYVEKYFTDPKTRKK